MSSNIELIDKESGNMAISAINLDNLQSFSTLEEDEEPLMDLPEDTVSDLYYPFKTEPRCNLCKSPMRERAEHVFLESKRKPQAVVNFFAQYYNRRISWECVATHMESHCTFGKIVQSGLDHISAREKSVTHWKYREYDLVLTGIMIQIDDVRGLDCSNNADLELKRTARLESLYSKLLLLRKERDEAGTQVANIFEILHEIYKSMPHENCRQIILDKVNEIRLKLAEA